MANKDLLKEAIADAKAVKEVAIANANLLLKKLLHLTLNQCYLLS